MLAILDTGGKIKLPKAGDMVEALNHRFVSVGQRLASIRHLSSLLKLLSKQKDENGHTLGRISLNLLIT